MSSPGSPSQTQTDMQVIVGYWMCPEYFNKKLVLAKHTNIYLENFYSVKNTGKFAGTERMGDGLGLFAHRKNCIHMDNEQSLLLMGFFTYNVTLGGNCFVLALICLD